MTDPLPDFRQATPWPAIETYPFSESAILRAMQEIVVSCMADIHAEFREPGDEFTPVLFTSDCNHGVGVLHLGEFLGDKDFLYDLVLPILFREHNVVAYVQVVEAWMTTKSSLGPEVMAPILDPDRQEVLVVNGASGDGDRFFWQRKILRGEQGRPGLGPWGFEAPVFVAGRDVELARYLAKP